MTAILELRVHRQYRHIMGSVALFSKTNNFVIARHFQCPRKIFDSVLPRQNMGRTVKEAERLVFVNNRK